MVWEIWRFGVGRNQGNKQHWVTLGQAMPAEIIWTLIPCALLCSLSTPEKQRKPTQNAELRERERKTSEEAEPSGLCPGRGHAAAPPYPRVKRLGRSGDPFLAEWEALQRSSPLLSCSWPCSRVVFSFPQEHGPAPLNLILSGLNEITAGLDRRTSRRVWKADKTLSKKPGREKRDPEAAAMFRMPYLANRL